MGETAVIPLDFTLPGLTGKDYGICHVDYELYDSDNHLVQPGAKSYTGWC
jgi:hypothetical protein